MGGRGSSFGVSSKGIPYGREFKSVLHVGNIKFLKKVGGSVTSPMETRTKGRIYVTLNKKEVPKFITFYDKNNKRYKQIDLIGYPHKINGVPTLPHTHLGYIHDEKGTRALSLKEKAIVEKVSKLWENRHK
ncbi:MAG: hypothetical protein K2M17_05590 [Bacilli bacterium]|nr:hypothetical protein [Bacilli bacterium]